MRPRIARLLAVGIVLGLGLVWIISFSKPAWVAAFGLNSTQEEVASRRAPALNSAPSSCYTWDFQNNTGLDVVGLVIALKGNPAITEVYTGVLNPFGEPDPSSGYNAETDAYTLVFGNGLVSASEMAQIGICTDQESLRLDPVQPAFYWVDPGQPAFPGLSAAQAEPAPLFAGLETSWIDPNHLRVTLYNEQDTPLTLFSFKVVTPDSALALEDLTEEIVAMLPLAADPIADPLTLAGGTSTTQDVTFSDASVNVGYHFPVVVEAVLTAEDDPANVIHLLAQTYQHYTQVFLPMTIK